MERSRWAALVLIPAVAAWQVAARADVGECLEAAQEGQTLRDAGGYRRARERFIACAGDACPGEVRKRCVSWLGDVEKLLPTVVLAARSLGKEVIDVRVTVDGELVAERIDGKPIGLDPGERHLRFERSGETPIDQTVVILAGEKERTLSVEFRPNPPSPQQSPPTQIPPGLQQLGVSRAAPKASAGEYGLAIVGLVAFAAGAALDGSGYVFLQQCNSDPSCTGAHERGQIEWRFVTGDLLLVGGVVSSAIAWLLWPRHSPGATTAPSGAGGSALTVKPNPRWAISF